MMMESFCVKCHNPRDVERAAELAATLSGARATQSVELAAKEAGPVSVRHVGYSDQMDAVIALCTPFGDVMTICELFRRIAWRDRDFCVMCRNGSDLDNVAALLAGRPVPQHVDNFRHYPGVFFVGLRPDDDSVVSASLTRWGYELSIDDLAKLAYIPPLWDPAPRPTEDAPSASTPWDGTGMPPVGTVCEIAYTSGEWGKCTILFAGSDLVVFHDGIEERYEYAKPQLFRPIRTDRERFIDAVNALFGLNAREDTQFESTVGAIWDAGLGCLPEVKP